MKRLFVMRHDNPQRLGCNRRRAVALRDLATRAPQVLAAHHPARRAST